MNRFHFLLILAGLVCSLCFGCSSGDLGTVSGTVKLNGQPLKEVFVVFTPEAGGRPSTAQTDQEGKYVLLYRLDEPGAEIGSHKVKIYYSPGEDDNGNPVPPPIFIPTEYNTNTELAEEVNPGENEINFNLKSSGGRPTQGKPFDPNSCGPFDEAFLE